MVRAREGVSIDDALQLSVGEFGREQQRLYVMVGSLSVGAFEWGWCS